MFDSICLLDEPAAARNENSFFVVESEKVFQTGQDKVVRARKERKELNRIIEFAGQRVIELSQFISLQTGAGVQNEVNEPARFLSVPKHGTGARQRLLEFFVRALILEVGRPMESIEIANRMAERASTTGRITRQNIARVLSRA